MPHQHRVLVVDDDPELHHFLAGELTVEGYSVEAVGTGQQALIRLRDAGWDLVLLDWSLPDFSGVEVCRRLRASELTTPVLMLTARDAVAERVEALDAGADDYLTKPFSIEELLARVRARLRRLPGASSSDDLLRFADLEVNTASHEVSRGGKPIQLTVREYDLLLALLREPQRVQERQALLHNVWGEHFVGDANLLDVYIRYLRKKIERPGLPSLIQTVRGVGFMLKQGEPKY
ncbi:response regulator transcription factor [Synechococcus sp. CBW1107]|uniref:response regulator transcription factor n=1 Tax=Synechococcus sp. CBW1107 TaxID=2789857 RepID=UPI0018CDC565|nr:response regulator transcription factor [Synechococcus sp. CBW1107]QPN55801.1 response regulator transcription factor [Synechococcus sp. CBW1107]